MMHNGWSAFRGCNAGSRPRGGPDAQAQQRCGRCFTRCITRPCHGFTAGWKSQRRRASMNSAAPGTKHKRDGTVASTSTAVSWYRTAAHAPPLSSSLGNGRTFRTWSGGRPTLVGPHDWSRPASRQARSADPSGHSGLAVHPGRRGADRAAGDRPIGHGPRAVVHVRLHQSSGMASFRARRTRSTSPTGTPSRTSWTVSGSTWPWL